MLTLLKNVLKKPLLYTVFSPWCEFTLKEDLNAQHADQILTSEIRNKTITISCLESLDENEPYHVEVPNIIDAVSERMKPANRLDFLHQHSFDKKPAPFRDSSATFGLSAAYFSKSFYYRNPSRIILQHNPNFQITASCLRFLSNSGDSDDEEEEGGDNSFFGGGKVKSLSATDFRSFLSNKKHTLVLFYSPYCPHCQMTKPEFSEAAKALSNNVNVAFASVDCTQHQGLCEEYNVQGYPTMLYFSYFKRKGAYKGPRTAKDFINFMSKYD